MSAPLARSLRVVLYEGVGSRSIPDADRFAMMTTLLQGGYAVTSVRTGSRTAPEGARTPIVVLGRFEHTPPREAESDSAAAPIFFRDIEGVEAPAIASIVVGGTAITGGVGSVWRTFVGALIVQVVRIGMTFMGVSVFAQQIVFGFILVAAVAITMDRAKVLVIK